MWVDEVDRKWGGKMNRAVEMRRASLFVLLAAAATAMGAVTVNCNAWSEESHVPDIQDSYRKVDVSPDPKFGRRGVPHQEEIPIDLPTVLRLAGSDALDVQFAVQRLQEARAQRLGADMQFLPTITPRFDNRWVFGTVQSTTGEFQHVHHKQSALEGVEAALDERLGENVFAALAARKRVEASEAGLRATADAAKIQAVVAYFNLVLARADQAIVEERLKQADETIRLTQELQKGGAALLSEVKRSQAAKAQVQQRLAGAREAVRFASLTLTDALHIDPLVTLVPQQQPQDIVSLVSPEKDISELVSDAIDRRPELAESRSFWAALDREKRASILAPLIPTIRADALHGSFGSHPDDGERVHDYYVGLQWRIGVGGIGDVSRTRLADARLKEEGIRFARIADTVVREVVSNSTHADTANQQIQLSKDEVAAADEALRLSQERLKQGSALTLEVLAAEDALFDAKSRAAQNISEFNKAQYGLLRSIGGFRDDDAAAFHMAAPNR